MIGKEHICFDPALGDLSENDNIGAFVRAGTDGDPISSGDGSSDNVANTFEGLDARSFMFAYDATGDNWDRLRINSSGELLVSANLTVDNDFAHAEDDAHVSGDIGSFSLSIRLDDIDGVNTAYIAGANGDYQGFFTDEKGQLYVTDESGNALLTTIDSVLDNILIDTNAMVVDLAAIEVELLDQGTTLDSILVDTNAMVVDLAAIEVELLDQGTTLDSVLVELQKNKFIGDCLRVTDAAQSIKTTAVSATGTQADLLTSALSNRTGLYVQNCGNRPVYIAEDGAADAAATGLKLSCGAVAEFKFGASARLDIKAAGGTQEVRVLEYAC